LDCQLLVAIRGIQTCSDSGGTQVHFQQQLGSAHQAFGLFVMFITILWKLTATIFIHGEVCHENSPSASVEYRFTSAENPTHRGVIYVQV
jgi:hypothetical protein